MDRRADPAPGQMVDFFGGEQGVPVLGSFKTTSS
jgi:hypothetical protein